MPLQLINYQQLYVVLCTTKIATLLSTDYALKWYTEGISWEGATKTMPSHERKMNWDEILKAGLSQIHNTDRDWRNVLPSARKVKFLLVHKKYCS